MSFESITLGVLTGSTAINDLCPKSKVFFGTMPRDTQPPFVLCTRVSTTPTLSTDNGAAGSSRLDHISLQVTCYTRKLEDSGSLCEAVRGALEASQDMAYILTDQRSDYDDFPDLYGQFLTFSCWYPSTL